MIKRVLAIVLLYAALPLALNAQRTIHYNYDNAGNRSSRISMRATLIENPGVTRICSGRGESWPQKRHGPLQTDIFLSLVNVVRYMICILYINTIGFCIFRQGNKIETKSIILSDSSLFTFRLVSSLALGRIQSAF